MSLQSQIDALCHVTNELLNLGFDGTPLYSNRFCELNTEVYRQSFSFTWFYCRRRSTALLCSADRFSCHHL